MAENCSWNSRLTSTFARPFVLWGIAALATVFTVRFIFKHVELHSPAKQLLGFLPALLAIVFVVAFVKDVRKLDEMVKRIHMQAAAIAFLLTVVFTFVFDGLKDAGIYDATRSDLSSVLFSISVFTWAVALIFLSLRYR